MEVRAALLLCCTIACGPPTIASGGGDETLADVETDGESTGETTGETTDESESDGDEECPEQPEVISCTSAQDCPDGFKCGGYTFEDCVFGGSGGDMACVPVIGDRGLGQACTTSTEDATPFFTWYLDDCTAEGRCVEHGRGSHEGTCVPYCEWEGEFPVGGCADPQRICKSSVCVQQCDPSAAGDPCEGEFVCGSYQFSKSEFYCSSAGFYPGEGLLGDECVSAFDCVNGLGCVAAELLPDCGHTSCCSPFCSLADIEPCAELGPGFSCVPFYEPDDTPPALEHVGLCASP